MRNQRRRRMLWTVSFLCVVSAVMWLLNQVVLAGFVAAAALLLALLLRKSQRGTRGARSHVNADGTAKWPYRSLRTARLAANEYERDFGDPMNAYRCAHGRHWHIGHRR